MHCAEYWFRYFWFHCQFFGCCSCPYLFFSTYHLFHSGNLVKSFFTSIFLGNVFIFNTPSHHRVHHAKDIEYLDKNYAGIFIIWDRMFKTFKKEEKEPTYGVLSQPKSFNPFYIAFYMNFKLAQDVIAEKSFICKL